MQRILIGLAVFLLTLFIYDSLFPPISTLMMARAVTTRSIARDFVSMRRISSSMVQAVIAAEDGKYCDHHGVDWQAFRGAVENVVDPDTDRAHGGSTITMQVVKNLFLWPGYAYLRKPFEIPLAIMLDTVWGKRRVMQAYLNIAEFGPGIYGVQTAATHYFGVSASNLSTHQAALLAASLPNPKKRRPSRPSGYMLGYASGIEARMSKGVASSCVR